MSDGGVFGEGMSGVFGAALPMFAGLSSLMTLVGRESRAVTVEKLEEAQARRDNLAAEVLEIDRRFGLVRLEIARLLSSGSAGTHEMEMEHLDLLRICQDKRESLRDREDSLNRLHRRFEVELLDRRRIERATVIGQRLVDARMTYLGRSGETLDDRLVREVVHRVYRVLEDGMLVWDPSVELAVVFLEGGVFGQEHGHQPLLVAVREAIFEATQAPRASEPSSEAGAGRVVQVVDWSDPRQVAVELVSYMGSDNGCRFVPTDEQMMVLTAGVETMLASGTEFGPQVVLQISAGEESEVQDRFGNLPGFDVVHRVMNQIFDGPSEP